MQIVLLGTKEDLRADEAALAALRSASGPEAAAVSEAEATEVNKVVVVTRTNQEVQVLDLRIIALLKKVRNVAIIRHFGVAPNMVNVSLLSKKRISSSDIRYLEVLELNRLAIISDRK